VCPRVPKVIAITLNAIVVVPLLARPGLALAVKERVPL
jgi:hypothetical protein